VVSSDHVHMHLTYRTPQLISGLVKRFKERTSWLLQQEFPELRKCYWGGHFWAIGYECWIPGNITDEMVNDYLEHHLKPNDEDETNFIIE